MNFAGKIVSAFCARKLGAFLYPLASLLRFLHDKFTPRSPCLWVGNPVGGRDWFVDRVGQPVWSLYGAGGLPALLVIGKHRLMLRFAHGMKRREAPFEFRILQLAGARRCMMASSIVRSHHAAL